MPPASLTKLLGHQLAHETEENVAKDAVMAVDDLWAGLDDPEWIARMFRQVGQDRATLKVQHPPFPPLLVGNVWRVPLGAQIFVGRAGGRPGFDMDGSGPALPGSAMSECVRIQSRCPIVWVSAFLCMRLRVCS